MRSPRDSAELLLSKARSDLFIADLTLPTHEALDGVCFHAQQAVEKSLKALLALNDIDYPLTHDVQWLLELVIPRYPQFDRFSEAIDAFELLAVNARYEDLQPTLEETTSAVEMAHEVFDEVSGIVVPPETPPEAAEKHTEEADAAEPDRQSGPPED